MVRWRHTALSGMLVAVTAAACSGAYGGAPDSNPVTGGDAAVEGGGPGPGPGPDGDAATPPDATTTPDGGSDAGSFSCASLTPAPLFCDDFDDKTVAGEGWSTVDPAGFTIALDTNVSSSPPKSILLSAVSNATTGSYKQVLKKDFSATYTDVTIDFDARVESGHYRPYVFNVYGSVNGHTCGYSIWLDLQDGTSTMEENAYDFTASSTILSHSYNFVAAVPKDKFRHYTLSVTLGTTSTAKLAIDGTVAVAPVTLDAKWVPLPLYIDFGLSYQALPADNVVHLDNVVVHAKP